MEKPSYHSETSAQKGSRSPISLPIFSCGRVDRDQLNEAEITGSWCRRSLVAFLVALACLTGVPPAQAALTPTEFEACLLQRINADRANVGAPALTMAWDRVQLVRDWSSWMSDNTFRHMTQEERAPILPQGTWTAGENLARSGNTSSDCSQVHSSLMNSGDHRANILNANFRFLALGAHIDSSWWVTQVFFNAPNYPPTSSTNPCPSGFDCDTMAFQDSGGQFHLHPALGAPGPISRFLYGNPGDVAFSGDWNCDGIDTLGLYRRGDGFVYLRNTNTQGVADISFYFGNPGDYPIAGDFDGDGCDSVSIYRPGEARFYIINKVGSNSGGLGPADYSFLFGMVGDKPFVGDFNGDGIDTIGLHRESTGLVYFRNTNSSGVADSQFLFGIPHDKLSAGDWDGDGDDTVGVYRPSNGTFYAKLHNTEGVADVTFDVGVGFQGAVALNP